MTTTPERGTSERARIDVWGFAVQASRLVPRNCFVLVGSTGVHFYNPADEDGEPSRIERMLRPVPGWSRYTLGGREVRRDRRRSR